MADEAIFSFLPGRATHVYVCHHSHPNDRIYTENIADYLSSLSIACNAIELNPIGSTPRLRECLNTGAIAVVGYNAALDHSWIDDEEFLSAAARCKIPVIQWILDHPSTSWPDFQWTYSTNSRFLVMSEYSQRYFHKYCLPGALTGIAASVGQSRHSRVDEFSAESFTARPINCLLPINLKRAGGTVDEARARIAALDAPLGRAVHAAIACAQFDLIAPLEIHLEAALKSERLAIAGNTFHSCLQITEEVVQFLRRRHIIEVACRFPVKVQSDESARTIWSGTVATLAENVDMKTTLRDMRSARAVVSLSNVNDMIHDRTVNGLNAGCVNIIEDNAIHRRYFEHGKNALLFRYDDDSLDECLDLVCNKLGRAYEIAAAGLAMRDELPFRFGGFHNLLDLGRQPGTSFAARATTS